jgi:hypothetical protein
MTFSSASGTNGMWSLNNSTARISVADSFDIISGQPNVIKNALPFASSRDPRVPVANGDSTSPRVLAEDGVTKPFYVGLLYRGQFDPLVLASGIDARLYEAEARLAANDIAGMMTILNTLRTGTPRPTIGITSVPAMATLATPATKDAATSLLFREKAFWTFGRGQRLPDLRRLIQSAVFGVSGSKGVRTRDEGRRTRDERPGDDRGGTVVPRLQSLVGSFPSLVPRRSSKRWPFLAPCTILARRRPTLGPDCHLVEG